MLGPRVVLEVMAEWKDEGSKFLSGLYALVLNNSIDETGINPILKLNTVALICSYKGTSSHQFPLIPEELYESSYRTVESVASHRTDETRRDFHHVHPRVPQRILFSHLFQVIVKYFRLLEFKRGKVFKINITVAEATINMIRLITFEITQFEHEGILKLWLTATLDSSTSKSFGLEEHVNHETGLIRRRIFMMVFIVIHCWYNSVPFKEMVQKSLSAQKFQL